MMETFVLGRERHHAIFALFTFSLLFPDSALNRSQNSLDVAMLDNTVSPSLSTSCVQRG